ncbi:hypothetical protein F3Y22_tig00111641pilonHSYRG00032 [Hibiscus syriacus]|uniref:BURP domain-containing protein n=1 Tax=Hibiscus syriacus TaxID=106335 RepID=A0A6A2YG05_HIBSY|nr:hypothetical protein F3Y22_tig00111641pilonHSYRG00032 [Hibiscus syriacus]
MKILSLVLALLALAVVASHTVPSPEQYWNNKLPNTPMPKVVQEILHPEPLGEKSTSVNVGGGGVNLNTGKGKPGGTVVNVGKGGVNVNTGKGKEGGGTHVNVGGKGVGVNTGKGKPADGTHVNVGGKGGGVSVSTGHKGKPVNVNVSPFLYNYAATENQIHDDPNVALFFLEKDMHPGETMTLHFTETTEKSTFLPYQISQSIPFSSNKLPEILTKFSVKPGTEKAETMKNTIKECEEPSIRGEEKYCATSLESMIDFTTSKLGKIDKAVSTEGADGTKAKAVAVCHTDTSAWNPKHLAFQVLKVEPGTVPICHFLPQDHIVWVPK